MHLRRHSMRRRFVALGLAYLLALQAILAAWAAVSPTRAGAATVSGIICASHEGGAGQPADRPSPGCLCGALCASGACAAGAPAPQAAVHVLRPIAAFADWSIRQTIASPGFSTAPWQARAPPIAA